MEPVALAAAAPRTPVAACRGGRFYLSEGRRGDPMGGDPMGEDPRGGGRFYLSEGGEGREEDVARGLVDYTLPHPRIFGPEAEERLLRLLAHLFACGPRADGSWEFTVNQEEHTPDQSIRLSVEACKCILVAGRGDHLHRRPSTCADARRSGPWVRACRKQRDCVAIPGKRDWQRAADTQTHLAGWRPCHRHWVFVVRRGMRRRETQRSLRLSK